MLLAALLLLQAADAPRRVALTFDDLPVVSALHLTEPARDTTTTRLLLALERHHAPATGFVNENKLEDSAGAVVASRVELLRRWLDAGHDLGNHTWSHRDLHRTPLPEYEADILKGARVLRQLFAERRGKPRYFRHPYLHTAKSATVRDSLDLFLAAHGYRIAPVTLDDGDYLFAAAYDRVRAVGDSATAQRIVRRYVAYMDSVVGFYQNQSRAILGREPAQILLVHANRLNGDSFDQVAAMFERRGYRFITLDEALDDPAYQSNDQYYGEGGITWLHRWAITAGVPRRTFAGEPEVPDWVTDLAAGIGLAPASGDPPHATSPEP